jgi:hypothetical protein
MNSVSTEFVTMVGDRVEGRHSGIFSSSIASLEMRLRIVGNSSHLPGEMGSMSTSRRACCQAWLT